MRLFTLLVTCAWLCATSAASPPPDPHPHPVNREESRSSEFFRIPRVTEWLEQQNRKVEREIRPGPLITSGDRAYWHGDYEKAALNYRTFIKQFGGDEEAALLTALVSDKLTGVYSLMGERQLAEKIAATNGKRVTFGTSSQVLYQSGNGGNCTLHLHSWLDTVAKIINQSNGKLEAVVWLTPTGGRVGRAGTVTLCLPFGIYTITCAQEVRKDPDGNFYALIHRELSEPVHLQNKEEFNPTTQQVDARAIDSININLGYVQGDFTHEALAKGSIAQTSPENFGSFQELQNFEQEDEELFLRSVRTLDPVFLQECRPYCRCPGCRSLQGATLQAIAEMQAEIEKPETSNNRKAQLKSTIASYSRWLNGERR